MKTYYRRHLPHMQPPGATLFITFRLYGSLPKETLAQLHDRSEELAALTKKPWNQESVQFKRYSNEQKRLVARYDQALHSNHKSPDYLRRPDIAKMVSEQLHRFDGQRYELLAHCIMPNHVHAVLTPRQVGETEYASIASIMHSIKSYTAKQANLNLRRTGHKFWAGESFDHYSRSEEETIRIIKYVVTNPVAAGLVRTAKDWPWSYVSSLWATEVGW